MKKRNNKRKYTLIIAFLAVDLLLILAIFNASNARFTSKAVSESLIDVALYALNEDNDLEITLDKMVPRNDPYVYNFKVINSDGKNITDTRMYYDLKIITTTNIPLEYKLCKNVALCQADSAENIINVDKTVKDADGTYFKTMTTSREFFGFEEEEENDYTLLVYFPVKYKSSNYQDLVESIQINIDSRQIIDADGI